MPESTILSAPVLAAASQPLLLTVLIPTRNRYALLVAQTRAVELTMRQLGVGFEIVVHDNSTLPAPASLKDDLPPSVRYIRSPELYDTAEENICAAFEHCRGVYVWMLADDDGVEPQGVAELLEILRKGEEDIVVFNSRHGRDERLGGHGGYITERARRLFYAKEMRCTVARFVQRTGFFYWICAISTVVVRRDIARTETLKKYLGIARIYAHVAWLIEIGHGRRFLFVNRPLVVYGLLPTDHDGGKHWRSVGVREAGYSNAVWTGLWLRALDELVATGALTIEQIRVTVEMNHATRFHWGANLAYQVLEQVGEHPEPTPPEEVALFARWLRNVFPGAIFLSALIDDVEGLTRRHAASLLQIERDSRFGQTARTLAHDLRQRCGWWRSAMADTPWYARFYVETLHLYDVYDLGDDWVAVHISFAGLREALEIIDLPSAAPAFLRAPSYAELAALIDSQPLDLEQLRKLRRTTLALPSEWGRLAPEADQIQVTGLPSLSVAAPPLVPPERSHQPDALQAQERAARLDIELARQDEQLTALYRSTSWRITAPLRWLSARAGAAQRAGSATTAPTLEFDAIMQLNNPRGSQYLARGFSRVEAWGRWTDGKTAVFRCRHEARAVAAELEIYPTHAWGPGATCAVEVTINGGRPQRRVVAEGALQTLQLTARQMTSPELTVTFRIVCPKAPGDDPIDEIRALGIGIGWLRLRWKD